jgi:hypothetical protein
MLGNRTGSSSSCRGGIPTDRRQGGPPKTLVPPCHALAAEEHTPTIENLVTDEEIC